MKGIRLADRSTAPTSPLLLGHGNAAGVQFVCRSRQPRSDTVVSKSVRRFVRPSAVGRGIPMGTET